MKRDLSWPNLKWSAKIVGNRQASAKWLKVAELTLVGALHASSKANVISQVQQLAKNDGMTNL
jgi:hypothetical protein